MAEIEPKKNGRAIPCWHASPHLNGLRDQGSRLVVVVGEDAAARHLVLTGWLPKLVQLSWRDQLAWVQCTHAADTMQWLEGATEQLSPPTPWCSATFSAGLAKGHSKKRKKGRHIVVCTDERRESGLLHTTLTAALAASVGLCILSVPSLTPLTEEMWSECGTVVIVPQPLSQPHPSPAVCVLAARWPQSVVTLQTLEQQCAQRTTCLIVMVWVPATTQWYWTAIAPLRRPPSPPMLTLSPPPSPRTEVTTLLEEVAEAHPRWAARCAAAILHLRGMQSHA
jgi:hypothetical protein